MAYIETLQKHEVDIRAAKKFEIENDEYMKRLNITTPELQCGAKNPLKLRQSNYQLKKY